MKKTIVLTILFLTFFSCENKLNILSDWKSIPVVFGIFNEKDSINYLKVNKVFLGQGDVMTFASNFDSIHYNPESISVLVHEKTWEFDNNTFTQGWITQNTHILEPVYNINKPEGFFHSPNQIIYALNTELNSSIKYSIEIIDLENDTILAYTDPIDIIMPSMLIQPNSFSALNIINNSFNSKAEWITSPGSNLFELKVIFKYVEFSIFNESDTIHKELEWKFPFFQSSNLNGNENMSYIIDPSQFYTFLISNIDVDPNLRRYVYGTQAVNSGTGSVVISHSCMTFELLSAGVDLSTLILSNQNSNSFVLEKIEYSNIKNGLGIFSSRNYDIVENVKINNVTNDSISLNSITQPLNFGYFRLNNQGEIVISYN